MCRSVTALCTLVLIALVAFVSLFVVSQTSATSKGAESRYKITSEPTCPGCSIEVSTVVTLQGSTPDEGLICDYVTVSVDSRNRFYVGPGCNRWEVLIYNDEGVLIDRIGQRGEGPGEFLDIGIVWVDEQDQLHVFDNAQRRRTVYSPEMTILGVFHNPGVPTRVARGVEGTLVQQIPFRPAIRSDIAGLPLHVVSESGEILRSFGASNPVFRIDQFPVLYERAIAAAGRGLIWSALPNQYVIELWRLDGTHVLTMERETSWFRSWDYYDLNESPSLVTSIRQDQDKKLWTLTLIAEDQVREGYSRPLYDSVIEVIDLRGKALVASRRVDRVFGRWTKGLLWSFKRHESGDLSLDIWRARVHDY